jgi:hypothetical protein
MASKTCVDTLTIEWLQVGKLSLMLHRLLSDGHGFDYHLVKHKNLDYTIALENNKII